MKILWFVNIPFPAVRERFSLSSKTKGWWLVSWAEQLAKEPDIKIGITCMGPVQRVQQFECSGITYFVIPAINHGLRGNTIKNRLELCKFIVDEFKPELVHVHGTESFFGLIKQYISVPILISIQGILQEIVKEYFGQMPISAIYNNVHLLRGYFHMKRMAKVEREVFNVNTNYMGMTDWTRGHVLSRNSKNRYFHCERAERDVFYKREWKIDTIKRKTIYCSSSNSPYKGIDFLLKTVALIHQYDSSVTLRIAGGFPSYGYGVYVRKIVSQLKLVKSVEFLGHLDGDEIVNELCQAHVFVLPSFMESMSNSLAEAMLIGCPCVAMFVGGVSSILSHKHTGLLAPKGDCAVMANYISDIMNDDGLALKYSIQAREAALERHNREMIKKNTIDAYRNIVGNAN